MKIKRGTVNESGLVFGGYGKSYLNGEWWTTPEKYEARKAKDAERAKIAYQASEERRAKSLARAKEWREGKGSAWVKDYDASKERVEKKRVTSLQRYQSDPKYRQKALDNNKKSRSTEHARKRESTYKSSPERLSKRRIHLAKRMESDFGFVIKTRIRNKLQKAIRANGIKASGLLSKYCGVSISTLKAFIEAQFHDGMSWVNRSKWHVDHFFPISMATDEKSLRSLSFFTNLRPMWAADNCRKNATPPTPAEMIERDALVENWIMNTQQMAAQ